jgi:hypothetical protein
MMPAMRAALWVSVLAAVGCGGNDDDAPDAGPLVPIGMCRPGVAKLEGEDLARLTHSKTLAVVAQAHPGDTVDIDLGYSECCYSFVAQDVCARFSVTPAGTATIDPDTGVLVIPASTPSGTTLHVTADVQEGDRLIELDVHVYSDAAMPQVGTWRERGVVSCDDGSIMDPVDPIGEVVFWADNTYSVTWQPIEIARDYTGSAVLDNGSISLAIRGGIVPASFDGVGELQMPDVNTIRLNDVWLGTRTPSTFVGCGHVLERSYPRPL